MSACWFVMVPDRAALPPVLAQLLARATSVVSYPSGRPWLLGSWPPHEIVLASAGERMLAVVGTSSTTTADLTARLKRVHTVANLEAALHSIHGSFHVAATLDRHLYLRGSASGARRVYRADIDGVTVCADRAHTVAWLTGAEPDTAQLAARLAVGLPHPLADTAMWRGVDTVTPGEALHLDTDGACRTIEWWHPPAAELPLAQAASLLREALRKAVALRARPGRVLAVDLSGGMDSTSLCFLAAEAGASLVTATLHWSAPGNQDHHYARYAANHLPRIEHLTFPSAELPACFSGLDRRHDPLGEPSALLRDREIRRHLAHAMRARGATLRLSGHGGDHVVSPPASYLHGLARRSPRLALRHTAGFMAHRRWPLGATARMLLGGGSYPAWLTAAAGRLREPAVSASAPETWGPQTVLPAWSSTGADDQLAGLLLCAAEQDGPLAADFGRHAWIHQMREAGRLAGLIKDAGTAAGLPVDSPFCDDAVLTACLSVRPEEAGHPWSYKPLLAAAMEGLVPEHLLARTTKDHCGHEWHEGLKAHSRQLADWADTSHLVAAGLVQESGLRRVLLSPGLHIGGAPQLENTLGTEEWLRDLAAHPVPDYLTHHQPHKEHPVDTATH
ncbi:asparagine synthase-related protein [Nocardia sp. NPDC057663]|uniref:asparagine synthase-related protein n=1 Tax=Nocardia sp. NPDC057663 TaxID=3346201 RepID=UPI00367260CE